MVTTQGCPSGQYNEVMVRLILIRLYLQIELKNKHDTPGLQTSTHKKKKQEKKEKKKNQEEKQQQWTRYAVGTAVTFQRNFFTETKQRQRRRRGRYTGFRRIVNHVVLSGQEEVS